MADLGKIALALPDVEQGIACAGTALESRTYRTKDKAFLFVSAKQARLKLEALPAASVIKSWIVESHALASGGRAKADRKQRRK